MKGDQPEDPPPPYIDPSLPGSVPQHPAPPLQPFYQPVIVNPQSLIRTQPTSIFVVGGSVIPSFGPYPVSLVCPVCRANVTTVTTRQPGIASYIVAVILCFVCWPLACLPFCMCEDWQDVTHTCPNCCSVVGVQKGSF